MVFKDITPLLADHVAFAAVVDAIVADHGRGTVDKVVGIEARGFILAAPVAYHSAPASCRCASRASCRARDATRSRTRWSTAARPLEVHQDAFEPGDRVLIVDDVLATGGTAEAAVELVRRAGAEVVGSRVLMELAFLRAASALARRASTCTPC